MYNLKLACLSLFLLLIQLQALGALSQDNTHDLEISYETLRSKASGKILPGDVIRVNVILYPVELAEEAVQLRYKYSVSCVDRTQYIIPEGQLEIAIVERKGQSSFDIEIPWCGMVKIDVTPIEGGAGKSMLLNVDPEVYISLPNIDKTRIEERREGGILILKVIIQSNIEGEKGVIVVKDGTLGLTLLEREVSLKAGIEVEELYVKLPENPTRLRIFKDPRLLHRIVVEYRGIDTYDGNNVDGFYVIIISDDIWRVPWAAVVVVGALILLLALVYISRIIYV